MISIDDERVYTLSTKDRGSAVLVINDHHRRLTQYFFFVSFRFVSRTRPKKSFSEKIFEKESMRSIILFLLLRLLLVPSGCAIPFGKRNGRSGASADDDDDDGEGVATNTVRGAARLVREHDRELGISELSASVASFFARRDDGASGTLKSAIETTANSDELKEFLTTTRRALHRDPEVMFELPHTSRTITSVLEELGIPFTTGWAKNTHPEHFRGPGGYGVVAHIGSMDADGPCIILRADSKFLAPIEWLPPSQRCLF